MSTPVFLNHCHACPGNGTVRSDLKRSIAGSCPSGTDAVFKIKAARVEPAGTYSGTTVPASRIPTRCVWELAASVVTLMR